jgi:hypothetical protein
MPDPKKPQPGELHIDASDVAPFAIDLPEGALRGLRTERDGCADVVSEILAAQAAWGDKAGVTAGDAAEIQQAQQRIALVDTYLQSAQKLVEILTETRAAIDDKRERLIGTIAESVERRAKMLDNGADLLAKYEKTRAYRSAPGYKAAKTRAANAKKDGEPTPAPVPDGKPA